MRPAIVLLEFDSIAVGIEAGDAMAKRAPLDTLHAGTVHPGRYLVLAGGTVGDVEEAWAAGREVGERVRLDEVFLPDVDPQVISALVGGRTPLAGDSLGVIETRTVASTLKAADAGVKGATVELLEIRLADDLGGKAYALFGGALQDVEAALEIGVASLASPDLLIARVVIPRLHEEMLENLSAHPKFGDRVRSYGGANRG